MRPLAAALAVFVALAAAAADAPKSKPKMPHAARKVKAKPRARTILGEVANTDILKGILSIRSADKAVRDYAVTDATKIMRKTEDKPDTALPFEAVNVGDAVEVSSQDGRTALEVRVHAAPKP